MKITIIGKGAWGSAIGGLLCDQGHEVLYLEEEDRDWKSGGPGDMVFLALPCQALRERLESLQSPGVPVVSLIKGIEVDRFLRVSQIVQAHWPDEIVACVSGPSFAHEVVAREPTAAVVACEDTETGMRIQEILHQKAFRLYRSQDLVGVELGGALKNVYALAGGCSHGLGIGENGRAALMTRSLAEMARIALSLGGRQETIYGLSGVGDLMLTAFSGASRNFQVGEALGQGRKLPEILGALKGTAEGVPTVEALFRWVQSNEIKAPIIHEIHAICYEGKSPRESIGDLMLREAGEE